MRAEHVRELRHGEVDKLLVGVALHGGAENCGKHRHQHRLRRNRLQVMEHIEPAAAQVGGEGGGGAQLTSTLGRRVERRGKGEVWGSAPERMFESQNNFVETAEAESSNRVKLPFGQRRREHR